MSDSSSLSQILWSTDPATRKALWTLLSIVVPTLLGVFATPVARLVRLYFLERRLRDTLDEYETKGHAAQRMALREWLRDSPIRAHFEEFDRRFQRVEPVGGGAAPVRLLDVLEDHPLMPPGPRRSLLPILPGIFLAVGIFVALFGLIPALTQGAGNPAAADPLARPLGLALRAIAWAFIAALTASVGGRLLEGAFEARARGLDALTSRAFEPLSPGELAEHGRRVQQASLETLGRELARFAHELNERLERGLQRIEQSSSRSASLVSQEQRGALHNVVQELSLSVRQGVDHHLAELRAALQRATDYQSTVTNGLSQTWERLVENTRVQDRVARTLADSATALGLANESLRSPVPAVDAAAGGRPPSLDALELERLRESEAVAAQIADELGQSLRSFTEQIQHIDRTMEALRCEIEQETRVRKESLAEATRRSRAERADPPPLQAPLPSPGHPPAHSPIHPSAHSSAHSPGQTTRERSATPAVSDRMAPAAAAASPARNAAPASAPGAPASYATSPEVGAEAGTAGALGRDLSGSGFRVGAPRAQGPDPYERLASGAEPPSNVRHFPTRDRELGDDLKLSGLLGPSTPRTAPLPAPPTPSPRPPTRSEDDADRVPPDGPRERD